MAQKSICIPPPTSALGKRASETGKELPLIDSYFKYFPRLLSACEISCSRSMTLVINCIFGCFSGWESFSNVGRWCVSSPSRLVCTFGRSFFGFLIKLWNSFSFLLFHCSFIRCFSMPFSFASPLGSIFYWFSSIEVEQQARLALKFLTQSINHAER